MTIRSSGIRSLRQLHMGAGVTLQSAGLGRVTSVPETVQNLDFLVERFLGLEELASRAYTEAFRFDQPHEELKDFLIALASDYGKREADGSRLLRAAKYELRLSFGTSNYFDPLRVSQFRSALLQHGLGKSVLARIFISTCAGYHQFRESAKQVLDSLNLPDDLMTIYEECRSRTPLLSVSPVSTTSPGGE